MAKFNAKRLKVSQCDYLNRYQDLNGVYLSEVIAKLTELQKKHGDEAVFNFDVDSEYGLSHGITTIDVYITSEREETDGEYKARHAAWQKEEKDKRDQAKQRRKQREEYERKEYERLAKKFGRK